MSALAYGYLVSRERKASGADAAISDKPENKLVMAIAALVPVDLLAVHTLVLGATTKTDEAGTTTITDSATLGLALPVLIVLGVLAFVVTRGWSDWENKDYVRALLPPLSFLAWAGLIGTTSALTPWMTGRLTPNLALLIGAALAVLLIAINSRVNPAKPA